MKIRIKILGLTCLICAVVLIFTFIGCNVYDEVYIEVIRPPKIEADTIIIPDWEDINNKKLKL